MDEALPQARLQLVSKCTKTVKVGPSCRQIKLCQREIVTDEVQERKNDKESSNIRIARVSSLMGSLPRKMAKKLHRVSAS